jgi:hypothetical protein
MADLETSQPHPRRTSPWGLAAAGLILMLVGYGLLTYAGAPTAAVEKDPHLEKLLKMAENDPAQQPFAERLRELERQRHPDRRSLLRPASLIAFYAGVLLFVAAGIRMYRQPPAATVSEEEENLENSSI